MCYCCCNCGKCSGETREALPLGKCAFCGHISSVSALVCESCGKPFPLPPGVSRNTSQEGIAAAESERVSSQNQTK